MLSSGWTATPRLNLSDKDIHRQQRRPTPEPIVTLSQLQVQTTDPRADDDTVAITAGAILAAARWLEDRIEPLLWLAPNWDSYGGRAVQSNVADFAQRLLAPLLAQAVPAPMIVPTSDGGLALEWHRAAADLVIHIPRAADPSAAATAFFADDTVGIEWEETLVAAAPRMGEALKRIMR
jgi:hypothetical protein